MNKKILYLSLLLFPLNLIAQNFNNLDDKQVNDGFGSGEVFSPFRNNQDSTKSDINVPKEIKQWCVTSLLGEIVPINADTISHLYQNWNLTEGMNGEYNYLGNMGSPRETRIFFNRPSSTTYNFIQPYDYFITAPDKFYFTDTKSPYTNLSYHSSGDKVIGDDRFRAYFSKSAGKRFGAGFLFDYLYGRGRYDNQSNAFVNFSLFSYYKSDKYSFYLLGSRYHMKTAENGGITNDEYITNPEGIGSNSNLGSNDIPVHFSRTWNRNEYYSLFLTQKFNVGFYREELMAVKDSSNQNLSNIATREILEDDHSHDNHSHEKIISEVGVDETIPEELKDEASTVLPQVKTSKPEEEYVRIFVPVTSFIHTLDLSLDQRSYINYVQPTNYYANSYLKKDSIDATDNFILRNTLGISLLEGFNKWAQAGLTAYASYDFKKYTLPDTLMPQSTEFKRYYFENVISIGGVLQRTQGKTIRYRLQAETVLAGEDIGSFSLTGSGDLNFKLLKDTVRLNVNAFVKNNNPSFYFRHYHSEHYWWDNDNLSKEFQTRAEGSLSIDRWRTKLSFGVENIKNYTYLANRSILATIPSGAETYLNSIAVEQENENIQVISATLKQDFKYKIFNFDTEIVYQKSSNNAVLPLPELNIYANLYISFSIAKVLHTELGADMRYFSSYYAPDYSAALGKFYQQNQAERIEIGNYPLLSVYANFHLKQTRFYVKYSHVNEGMGNRNYFLVPHYPLNQAVLWFGLSWNFYN